MGATESHTSEDLLWKFTGRDSDVNKIYQKLSKGARQLNVVGLKKIGKSRVMVKLFKKIRNRSVDGQVAFGKCVYANFENIDAEHDESIFELVREMLQNMGAESTQPYATREAAVNLLIQQIQKFCKDGQKITFCLDNLDQVMQGKYKDQFLNFVSTTLIRCSNTKFVLAHSIKSSSTKKNFVEYELKPLEKDAIEELLFEIVENKDEDEEEDDDDQSAANGTRLQYRDEMEVFTPDNELYIKAVAGLCEGLPLAAEMAGLLLKEDDYLFSPAELVELLIVSRLRNMSPENVPPDERLDNYKHQFETLNEQLQGFADNLNQQMKGCKFTIDDAMIAANKGTSAEVKNKSIKPFLNRCLMSVEKMGNKQLFNFHGFLRESQVILGAIENLPEAEEPKEIVFKFMKENMKKAGLPFEDSLLKDRKALELAIRSLHRKPVLETAGQNTDDSYQGEEEQFDPQMANETVVETTPERNRQTQEEVCCSPTYSVSGHMEREIIYQRDVSQEDRETVGQTVYVDMNKLAPPENIPKNASSSSIATLSDDDSNSPFPTKPAGDPDNIADSKTCNKDLQKPTPASDPLQDKTPINNTDILQTLTLNDFSPLETNQQVEAELERAVGEIENPKTEESSLGSRGFLGTGPKAMEYIPGSLPVQDTIDKRNEANTTYPETVSDTSIPGQKSKRGDLPLLRGSESATNGGIPSLPGISLLSKNNRPDITKLRMAVRTTLDEDTKETPFHDSKSLDMDGMLNIQPCVVLRIPGITNKGQREQCVLDSEVQTGNTSDSLAPKLPMQSDTFQGQPTAHQYRIPEGVHLLPEEEPDCQAEDTSLTADTRPEKNPVHTLNAPTCLEGFHLDTGPRTQH